MWTKILEIDKNFFQLRNDDDAYDFAAYACVTQVNGDIYLEHDVSFDDIEDERITDIIDGLDGIGVNLPINPEGIIAGYLSMPQKKFEDDDYLSDELDNPDPDESGDD
ncbi:hypothetical protein KIW84_051317 [Lathyrus oleraceus]|uniref:Uncharacterized protein n=1 Tax=Pisum sativum TaxID=3888 RepID=A0A9D4WJW2_PEA|nr:hypothetical protein KIW84_051317 [Pisum sativum]